MTDVVNITAKSYPYRLHDIYFYFSGCCTYLFKYR